MKKVKSPKGARPGEAINPLNEEQVPIFLEHAKNDRHYTLMAYVPWHRLPT